MNLKTKIFALFCACFLLLNAVDMLIPRSEQRVFDNLIRLHVLADDNSDTAQSIKLKVRDAVLEECAYLFDEQENVLTAESEILANLEKIELVANRVLAENGVDYKASAELGYEEYPTRVYENITLPAGEYKSLRLKLGRAEGENWWCILFPPLCTKASSATNEDIGVNKSDTRVFTSKKYIFRFKLLEIFGG